MSFKKKKNDPTRFIRSIIKGMGTSQNVPDPNNARIIKEIIKPIKIDTFINKQIFMKKRKR